MRAARGDPGSHRLPFLSSRDVGISVDDFRQRGYGVFEERYEPRVKRLVDERSLAPHHFLGKRGDTLIWHTNLLHGGSARTDVEKPRRSVVCHFFAQGSICYHDLAGTLATFGRQTYD